MKLVKYNNRLSNPLVEVDRLFNSVFGNYANLPSFPTLFDFGETFLNPIAGYSQDDDNYYVRFELPGVKKNEITVELDNTVLSVKAQRKGKGGESQDDFSISRSVSIPEGIEIDKIKANYEDGVLTVSFPKSAALKPRKIELN